MTDLIHPVLLCGGSDLRFIVVEQMAAINSERAALGSASFQDKLF